MSIAYQSVHIKMKQQGTFPQGRYNMGASCKSLSVDDAFLFLVLVLLWFFLYLMKKGPGIMMNNQINMRTYLIPWMLITSSVFSFATSLPFSWDSCNAHSNFTTPLTMTNSSERIATRKTNILFLILLCNVGIALPSIMFVFSSILLIRSLWRHTRQMQNNATGFGDPSLEALTGATKTVFSFLLLYITNFIALILILSDTFVPLSIEEAICVVVVAACPAGQSMVLIWSNPKFRELLTSILHHINSCVRARCS
uniref:Taste receptor type 2 member 40 n=1 Tax=Pavo cristatus TaxID=9049 RepID=A0A8C9LDX8_PAVCR